ncbi:hypothetical protein BpHYR1_039120 [Brachionus plicatilis]|uniref:Uncharacterized protein n=1 Tax=Brachionus plicatilis TaxID=10195 RepID=A0A3M7Q2I7_BRAPC|nr:hypothetical protein BpHYR1_039120 [Brachionus plicatilis]
MPEMTNIKTVDKDRLEAQVTVKSLDQWLFELKERVVKLEETIAAKDSIITGLTTRIEELEKKNVSNETATGDPSSTTRINFASIAQQLNKPGSILYNAAFKSVFVTETNTVMPTFEVKSANICDESIWHSASSAKKILALILKLDGSRATGGD